MFFGFVALASNVPVWVLTSADGVTAATADATPTYAVYEEGTSTSVVSGTMTAGEVDSKTGLYRLSIAATAANGFAKGKTYLVHFDYAISTTTYNQVGTFVVV